VEWGDRLRVPGEMTLIGSGALLWQAGQYGIETPLPENSMDVDVVTSSVEIAELAYDAHIGSAFEKAKGWHVHLMPEKVLREMPTLWRDRVTRTKYGALGLIVPEAGDLLSSKLLRGEPRDFAHERWALETGLC
jgi:hypothetical protein